MRNLGLIVTFWLSTLILPTNSLALGLGEIEVTSFLNQPLEAEIEVISARAGEIDDLLVSLASREAFTRAGLSRPRNLAELRFSVSKNEAGDKAVILVTTKTAVKEPFLNFLIEADWSKGRVLREFTILLDPPFYADTPVEETASSSVEELPLTPEPAEQPVSSAASDESIADPIVLSEDSSSGSIIVTDESVVEENVTVSEGDTQVFKGDTLWGIASRYKDSSHSMAQVMLAIQRSNPDAFGNGNINNLKVGAVLRAPGADEIDALSQQEAYARVLEQNGLWDDYVARVTGVSPSIGSDSKQADSVEGTQEGGELSLLVPGDGDSKSSGTGDSKELNELRTKLAMAEEELDATRVENSELESRVSELQARLSKVEELQKMVQIEDDSLAQMQSQQVEDEKDSTETISEEMQAEEAALLEELLAEEAAAQALEQAQPAIETASIVEDTVVDTNEVVITEEIDENGNVVVIDDDMVVEVEGDDMVVEVEDSVPPTPVIITESSSRSPSMFDGILPASVIAMIPSFDIGSLISDPIILGAVGGVIVLLLLLFLLKRRKRSADQDGDAVDGGLFSKDTDATETGLYPDDEEDLTPIHLAETDAESATNINVPDAGDLSEEEEGEDEFSKTAVLSEAVAPEAPAPAAAAEQDDVLNEVDVYLAYGLYDNAEDLLNSNLSENPDRADYRSKLLDTYFATKNTDAFLKEAETLKSMGEPANRYWDRVLIMGYELAPDNALFSEAKDSNISAADLEIAKPQAADFDLGSGGDEDPTNFSTTDFNLGDDIGDDDSSDADGFGDTQVTQAVGSSESLDDLDNLPGLGDEDDTNISADAVGLTDDELELPEDIGGELDFTMDDSDVDPAAEKPDESAIDFELPDSLDLGLDDDESSDDENSLGNTDEADVSDETLDDIAMAFSTDGDADPADIEDELSEFDIGAEFDGASDDSEELDIEEDMIPFGAEETTEGEALDVKDFEETAIVEPASSFEETSILDEELSKNEDSLEIDLGEEPSEIDLGMDDTSAMPTGEVDEEDGDDLIVDFGDDTDSDSEEDISVIDFGGDDFEIDDEELAGGTLEVDSLDEGTLEVDTAKDIDAKTGTFAPGDFEDAGTADLSEIDDIENLMLPDDVDEVSTKLDLARAFIDMGDNEGARGSLEEVISEGNEEQKAEAKSLLDQI